MVDGGGEGVGFMPYLNDLAWRFTYKMIYLKNACFHSILGLAMPFATHRGEQNAPPPRPNTERNN